MDIKTVTHQNPISPSELIVTEEGRIYHLDLHPDDIADDIIVVGDQERVPRVSKHFEKIDFKRTKREFITHTGEYNGNRVSVLSTGIGCDNIDIVINELDALVNIDLETRLPKSNHRKLNIIRIGTSGALQEDIPIDSFVLSTYALGFDGLLGFYDVDYSEEEKNLAKAFLQQTPWPFAANRPYFVKGSNFLKEKLGDGMYQGITATANGFYGPQGRSLRLGAKVPNLNEYLNRFEHKGNRITNFEMETSALYGLCALLGHEAGTVCAIIANRFSKSYSKDYKKTVDQLIELTLHRLTQ